MSLREAKALQSEQKPNINEQSSWGEALHGSNGFNSLEEILV